jgi:DNA-binding MarR family transcriptional regulator
VATDPKVGTRSERVVRAVDGPFERVGMLVGTRIARWIDESGLDLNEARVLVELSAAEQAMTAAEIAEPAGLDLDSAYRAVHALHGCGLTTEHARRHELTDRGRALVESFADAREEGVRAFIKGLEEGERRRLESVFGER